MNLIKRYPTLSYFVFLILVSLIVNLYFYWVFNSNGPISQLVALGGPTISTFLFISYDIRSMPLIAFFIGSGIGWLAWYFSIKHPTPLVFIFAFFAVIIWIVVGYVLLASSFYA